MRIAIIALVTNMLLNLVFVVPMVLLEIPAPHAGLALATSIAAWVNAGLLLYTLKNRVNQYYFSILMLQAQRNNLEIHLDNLDQRRGVMQAATEEGVWLEEELKVIDVEMLKIRQSINEVESRKLSMLGVLDLLCGGGISSGTVLQKPELEGLLEEEGIRESQHGNSHVDRQAFAYQLCHRPGDKGYC